MTDKTRAGGDAKAIAALYPPPKHLKLAEELEIDVPVLNAGQIVKIMKVMAPALLHLRGLDGLRSAMSEHLDCFASAAAIAIGWTEDDFLALPPDAFIAVVEAVVEVNMPYFQERIAPALERLFAEATKAAPAESEA